MATNKSKRAKIRRALRSKYVKFMLESKLICKRRAKRWIEWMYNQGKLEDY